MLSKTWHNAALYQAISNCRWTASGLLPLDASCVGDVPSTALFDFGDVELEKVVQPGDEFLSARVMLSAHARDVKQRLSKWEGVS